MLGPRTPAEFRCAALKAFAGDELMLPVIDEITEMIERVYVGEQLEPTPCQLLAGKIIVAAIETLLVSPIQICEPS